MSELEVDILSLSLTFDFEAYFTDKADGDGDDKDGSDICRFFLKGSCTKGTDCPYKHTKAERAVVCKHWLRGLCKKGELCEFLHEYDLQKMPECYFFSKHGECNNQECMYLHVNPEEKVRECPWYSRGFCKHGPKCRHKHIKKLLCENYYLGFCPEGPKCKYGHPKYELPKEEPDTSKLKVNNIQEQLEQEQQNHQQQQQQQQQEGGFRPKYPYNKGGGLPSSIQPGGPPPYQGGGENGFNPNKPIVCHKCGTPGHKSNACPNAEQFNKFNNTSGGPPSTGQPPPPTYKGGYQGNNFRENYNKENYNKNNINGIGGSGGNVNPMGGEAPNLDSITCKKCLQTGHYANKCPNKKVGGYQGGYQGNNYQQPQGPGGYQGNNYQQPQGQFYQGQPPQPQY